MTVLNFPQSEPRPDCLARTVGELLRSIAYLIERGEYDTALRQARDCSDAYFDVPLPELDDANE
ncbi:hypothetical protein [Saccharopolyspora sp. NPDC002376]